MTDALIPPGLDMNTIGNVAETVSTLAWTNGITADPKPVDRFTDAAARLPGAHIAFDRAERLLIALARAGLVTDEQRFALHAAYLHQKGHDVRSVR